MRGIASILVFALFVAGWSQAMPRWVARQDRDLYCAVADGSGNVYAGGYDGRVVKFNSAGQQQWVWLGAIYRVYSIRLDAQGNVFALGYDGLAKLTSDGQLLWILPSVQGFTLAADGSFFVTGSYNNDLMFAKYSGDGSLIWRSTFPGPAGIHDYATSVRENPDGTLIVNGEVDDSGKSGGPTAVTLKASATGQLLWNQIYTSQIDSYGGGTITDTNANLYKVITLRPIQGSVTDVRLVKYSPDGNQIWDHQLADGTNLVKFFLDANGAIVKAFFLPGSDTHTEVVVRRFDTNDNFVSETRTPTPWTIDAPGRSLLFDSSGNMYLSATSTSYLVALKANPAGQVLWRGAYRGPDPQGWAASFSAIFDSAGNFLSVGRQVKRPGPGTDGIVLGWDQRPPYTAASFTVVKGRRTGGNLASLLNWDGNYLDLRPRATLSIFDDGTQLLVTTVLPLGTIPEGLGVTIVDSPYSTPTRQRIYFYDWTAQAYVLIDSRQMTFIMSLCEVTASQDVARFIDPATGTVRVLFSWYSYPVPLTNNNRVQIDQLVFHTGQ